MSKKVITFYDSEKQAHDFPIVTPDYGVCDTNSDVADKIVTCDDFSLFTGAEITVKFNKAPTTDVIKLNVNNSGAIAVDFSACGNKPSEIIKANGCYGFVYDGTSWIYKGSGASGVGKPGTGVRSEIFNNYQYNIASGEASHAEGMATTAIGDYSHTEGAGTKSKSTGAHAEGTNSIASGYASHAEGQTTLASGDASHTEGTKSIASGSSSHAEGSDTQATGTSSHAEGSENKASHKTAHVEGRGNETSSDYQHVQGKYSNKYESSNYAHIVGNGTSDTDRSNAHTLDWSGNAWYQGNIKIGGTSYDDTNAKTIATIDDVKSNLSTVYKIKGTKSPYPLSISGKTMYSTTDLNVGDVYNISESGRLMYGGLFTEIDSSLVSSSFTISMSSSTNITITANTVNIAKTINNLLSVSTEIEANERFNGVFTEQGNPSNGFKISSHTYVNNSKVINITLSDEIKDYISTTILGLCYILDVNAGDNVVWTEKGWDKLAADVDLSNYYKKTDVDNLLAKKADKKNGNGGFVGGENASAEDGGAIGKNAYTYTGGAVGYKAETADGGSVGYNAKTFNGGAVGYNAETYNGFAGGNNAKTVDSSNNAIDGIQLGTGTNPNEFTAQFYDYQLLADDAKSKSATDGSKYLKDVGKLSDLTTTNKSNIVSAINELDSNKANKQTANGGFAAGKDATVSDDAETGGVAIGNKANAKDGISIGKNTRSDYDGISIGKNASSGMEGISIGSNASSVNGCIQLGKGLNEYDSSYTMKVYDYWLLDDDADVADRDPSDGSKYLKDVGVLNKLNTTNKTDIVSAINEVKDYVDNKVPSGGANASTVTSCTGDELAAIASPIMGSIRYVSAVGTGNNTSITPGLYFYLGSWKKVALEDTAIISNEFVSGGDSTSLK